MHPDYFLDTPEQTLEIPETEWQRRIHSDQSCAFGLFHNRELIGITGIFKAPDTPDVAKLVMSYIKPEYRGRGLSALFYQVRLEWARVQPDIKRLQVSHRKGNEASRKAILSHGFVLDSTEPRQWPDGTIEADFIYYRDASTLS